MHSVETASKNRTAGPIDFSLFTDGLRAEREQGITIDVAYRYFATARRKFILADTPGHEQYTRNMATGASTADVAILLVDARHGVRPQSRRHARIARLLGIPTSSSRSTRWISSTSTAACSTTSATSSPAAADGATLHADPDERAARRQRHHRSDRTPWFDGAAACSSTSRPSRSIATRRPSRSAFRCSSCSGPTTSSAATPGRSSSGTVRAGRRGHRLAVRAARTRVKRIVTWDGDLEIAPRADVGDARARGRDRHQPRRRARRSGPIHVGRRFAADVVWMDERPLDPGRVYLLKHTTRIVTAEVDRALALNEIGIGERHDVAAARVRSLRREPARPAASS